MLGLQLREESRGAKLQGTTIDFSNDSKTGALDQSAKERDRLLTLEGAAEYFWAMFIHPLQQG